MIEDELQAVLDNNEKALIIFDTDFKIKHWNKKAEFIYDFTAQEAIGSKIDIITTEHILLDESQQLQTGKKSSSKFTNKQKTSDGLVMTVESHLSPIFDQNHQLVAFLLCNSEETEEVQSKQHTQYIEKHDPLTGLYNRATMLHFLQERLNDNQQGKLLLLDVNNLKLINDAYGQQIGDNVLQAIAQKLTACLDSNVILAHFNGDQFAILLNQDQEKTINIQTLLEEIETDIKRHFLIALTFSSGAIHYDENHTENLSVLNKADNALFEAKEQGKHKHTMVDYDGKQKTRLHWMEKIRHALDKGRLVLYGQPIAEIRTGHITQHELLLRMNDPDEGLVSPGPFLSIAEKLGLISEIDRWVVNKGLEFVAETNSAVEINLSGDSMNDQTMLNLIEDKIKQLRIEPDLITFEITETTAIANLEEAIAFVSSLRQLGCHFALDDFGTGFASFIYLKHLPVSVLKIDGEFIKSITEDEIDQSIVSSIVNIAKTTNKKIIAEWVTSQESMNILHSLGVDYAQGYYIGKPIPLTQIKQKER